MALLAQRLRCTGFDQRPSLGWFQAPVGQQGELVALVYPEVGPRCLVSFGRLPCEHEAIEMRHGQAHRQTVLLRPRYPARRGAMPVEVVTFPPESCRRAVRLAINDVGDMANHRRVKNRIDALPIVATALVQTVQPSDHTLPAVLRPTTRPEESRARSRRVRFAMMARSAPACWTEDRSGVTLSFELRTLLLKIQVMTSAVNLRICH